MRVVSVVLGTSSDKARIDGSAALINYGFRFFETRLLYKAGQEITRARVWKSELEYSPLGLADDLFVTVPRGSYDSLESIMDIPAQLEAPLSTGQAIAELRVSLAGDAIATRPLRALADNPTGSLWQRARDTVSLWFE